MNKEKSSDDNAKQSKLLKEYFSFKESFSDAIIFIQIGDFFETLFDDAKIFSEVTGVALSSRNIAGYGKAPQAGVPQASVDVYIKKMLLENYKVCVCKQFSCDDGSCYRMPVRIYTPGTIIEQEFLDSSENNYILSVVFDGEKYILSYADVSTGQFYKTSGQYKDIQHEIEKIEPNELLILKKQEEIFKDFAFKFNTTYLKEAFFETLLPADIITEYCKINQKEYISKMDKIVEYKLNSFMKMDNITRRNLELTRTKRYLKKKGSLLWFLNYTNTPMGIRMLKKYVDEPLLDIEQIKKRQAAVEELINNKHLLDDIEKCLKEFCDLSRICAKVSNSTIYPKDLYNIVDNACEMEMLAKICISFKSPLLNLDLVKMNEVLELAKNIKNALKKDLPNELKAGGIINDGYDSYLDYLKNELKICSEKIVKYEKSLQKTLGIDKLKIFSSRSLGYYIEVPKSHALKLSVGYYKKQVLANHIRFTSDKLKEIEQEYYNLKYQVNEMEYDLYCKIRKHTITFVDSIRELAKDIARIDALYSFSRCAIINNLIKPNLVCRDIFVKDGFHPSLIKLRNDFVKNDALIKDGCTIILTGANMSGKSTFLKQNAIICLLSQIGSFVPASKADLPIIDNIFLRQGSTDDIINNNSSFMVEMMDLKYILDNVTNSSLVLLDEPAKSTNEKEGGAIARAFCEYILNHYSVKTLIATHNLELTKLEEVYQNKALNYVIGNPELSEYIVNDRKIKRGVINSSMAINTAILAQLPEEVIETAKKYIA